MIHRTSKIALCLALVATVVLPAAVQSSRASAAVGVRDSLAFCSSLASRGEEVLDKLNAKKAKVDSVWAKQDARLKELAADRDSKITSHRASADEKLQSALTALQAKATSETQKTAAMAYVTAVSDAVATRRAAYDAARAAYRESLQEAVNDRRTLLVAQQTDFLQTVTNANKTAATACGGNPTEKNKAAGTWLATIRTAKESFVVHRADDAKIGDAVKPLIQIRQKAFRVADKAFQQSLKDAGKKLEAAMPGV